MLDEHAGRSETERQTVVLSDRGQSQIDALRLRHTARHAGDKQRSGHGRSENGCRQRYIMQVDLRQSLWDKTESLKPGGHASRLDVLLEVDPDMVCLAGDSARPKCHLVHLLRVIPRSSRPL